jgi:hypothetical protein
MAKRAHFSGAWRILQMELWDRDFLDLEGPAQISFDADRLGSFRFGAVQGWIDYRVSDERDIHRVDFSWEGTDDGDPRCGRGWAILTDGQLVGRLYFHNGDDSAFVAEPARPSTSGSKSRRPASNER